MNGDSALHMFCLITTSFFLQKLEPYLPPHTNSLHTTHTSMRWKELRGFELINYVPIKRTPLSMIGVFSSQSPDGTNHLTTVTCNQSIYNDSELFRFRYNAAEHERSVLIIITGRNLAEKLTGLNIITCDCWKVHLMWIKLSFGLKTQ